MEEDGFSNFNEDSASHYFSQTSYQLKPSEAEESLSVFISQILNPQSIRKNRAEDTLKNLDSFRSASVLIANLVFKDDSDDVVEQEGMQVEDLPDSVLEKELSFSFGQADIEKELKGKPRNSKKNVIFKDLESLSKVGTLELRVLFHLLPILDSTVDHHLPLYKSASISVSDFGAFLLQSLCYSRFKNYFCHLLTSLKLAAETIVKQNTNSLNTQETAFSDMFSKVSDRIKCCDPTDDRVSELLALVHPTLSNKESSSTYFLNLAPSIIKLFEIGHHFLPKAGLFVFETVLELFHFTQDPRYLEVLNGLKFLEASRVSCGPVSASFLNEILNMLHVYLNFNSELAKEYSIERFTKLERTLAQSLCQAIENLSQTSLHLVGTSQVLASILNGISTNIPLTVELSDSLLYLLIKLDESYSSDNSLRLFLNSLHFSSSTSRSVLLIASSNRSKAVQGSFLFPWPRELSLDSLSELDSDPPDDNVNKRPRVSKKDAVSNKALENSPEPAQLIISNIQLLFDMKLEICQRKKLDEVIVSHLSSQAILILTRIHKTQEFSLNEVVVLIELGLKSFSSSKLSDIYIILGVILESIALYLPEYFTIHPIGSSWLTKVYQELLDISSMIYYLNYDNDSDCIIKNLKQQIGRKAKKIWFNFIKVFTAPWVGYYKTINLDPQLFLLDSTNMSSHIERINKEITSLGFTLNEAPEDFDLKEDTLFSSLAPIGMAGLFYLNLTSDIYRGRCSALFSFMIIYSCLSPCPINFKKYGQKLLPGILSYSPLLVKWTNVKLDVIFSNVSSFHDNLFLDRKDDIATLNICSLVCCNAQLNQVTMSGCDFKYHLPSLKFPCLYCDRNFLLKYVWYPSKHVFNNPVQPSSPSILSVSIAQEKDAFVSNVLAFILDRLKYLESTEERNNLLLGLGRMIIHAFPDGDSMEENYIDIFSSYLLCKVESTRHLSRAIVYNTLDAPLSSDKKLQFIDMIITRTEQILKDHPTNEIFKENLVFLTNIARATTGPPLLKIIKILCSYFCFEELMSLSSIYHKLHTIASAHKTQLRTLVLSVWPDMMDDIVRDFKNNQKMIKNFATVLSQDMTATIRLLSKHLVPRFVQDCDMESMIKVSEVWKDYFTERDEQDELLPVRVLVHNLDHTIARLLMSTELNKKPFEFVLTNLSKLSPNIQLNEVINSCSSTLILMLVQEFGSNHPKRMEKVTHALDRMAEFSMKKTKKASTSLDHKSLILSQLMHIIASFNGLLSEYHEDKDRQIKLLKALDVVVGLSDNQIGKCVPQLLSTLNLSVFDSFLVSHGIKIFETLISSTKLTVLSLFINQIVTILINCYNKLSNENRRIALKTIEKVYLNSDESPNLMLIVFTNYHSDFDRLDSIVANVVSTKSLTSRFELYTELLTRETNAVCQLVLNDFLSFLNDNQNVIATWSLDEPINHCISISFQALLNIPKRFPSSENEELHRLTMLCFGSLGAVDPDRLVSFKATLQSSKAFRPYDRNSCIVFASGLIEKHLYIHYTGSDAIKSHFGVAYAIQELMKFCDFNHSTITTNYGSETAPVPRKLWDNYSAEVKEAILPLLNGNYTVNNTFKPESKNIIYSDSITFESWLCEWTTYLITQVNHEASKEMFNACFSAAEKSVEIAGHLLPYLILAIILQNNSTMTNQIHNEMMFILNEAANLESPAIDQNINKALKEIFSVFVFFIHWECTFREEEFRHSRRANFSTSRSSMKPQNILEIFNRFVDSIPKTLMADAARKAFNHIHSLFYLELCANEISLGSKKTHLHLPIFAKLHETYYYLDDGDALQGVQSQLLVSSPEQQLREHETEKNWAAAQTCYEVLANHGSDYQSCQKGITSCLKNMGSLDLATHQMLGLSSQMYTEDLNSELQNALDESTWRLTKWDDELLNDNESEPSLDLSLGRLLSSISRNRSKVPTILNTIQNQLLPEFLSNISSSYKRCYGSLTWLHILNEVENFDKKLYSTPESQRLQCVESSLQLWDLRLNSTSSSFKNREKILNFQRNLISAHFGTEDSKTGIRTHPEEVTKIITRNLIQCAKLARKEGYFQLAYKAILSFPNAEDPACVIERAKWHWSQGQNWKAIQALTKLLGDEAPDLMMSEFRAKSKERNKGNDKLPFELSYARLVLNKWMIKSSACSQAVIVNEFAKLKQDQGDWDKCYFHAAQYFFKTIASISVHYTVDQVSTIIEMVHEVIDCSYHCLKISSKYVYQLLPRVLTTWIHWSMATNEIKFLKSSAEKNRILAEKLRLSNEKMKLLSKDIPSHYFLVVFSQLISRFDIEIPKIWDIIQRIVLRVMVDFPQQTFWSIVCTANSKDQVRKHHCRDVLSYLTSHSKKLSQIYVDLQNFTTTLLELSKASPPKNVTECPLTRLLPTYIDPQPLSIIMPTLKALSYNLPSAVVAADSSDFTPFSQQYVTIDRILPDVKIMNSLQRPLRISILGSDKKAYTFLVKAHDDLRKDARINEFNNLLNRLFNQNPESRRRQLHIRTFTALPLTNAAGLIEWVPHTDVYRNCLVSIGLSHSMKFPDQSILEKLNETVIRSREDNIALFEEKILPISPVVFYKWFLSKFPDPFRWLAARQAYAHSCATMSMVGFVVGLGDRHSENILMDETTGDLIHVDFSCLFERGLDLKFPEFVPFRLTHNMVHALGATGYEGTFRKSCETTMRILRNNKDVLKTLLETFLYDPMEDFVKIKVFNSPLVTKREKQCRVEFIEKFTKDPPHRFLSSKASANNPHALWALKRINDKLEGVAASVFPPPPDQPHPVLSVEGQVLNLILSATDSENLCRLYVGWYAHF